MQQQQTLDAFNHCTIVDLRRLHPPIKDPDRVVRRLRDKGYMIEKVSVKEKKAWVFIWYDPAKKRMKVTVVEKEQPKSYNKLLLWIIVVLLILFLILFNV